MITIIIPYVLHYATHFEQSQLLYQKTNEVVLPSNHSFIKRKSPYWAFPIIMYQFKSTVTSKILSTPTHQSLRI